MISDPENLESMENNGNGSPKNLIVEKLESLI